MVVYLIVNLVDLKVSGEVLGVLVKNQGTELQRSRQPAVFNHEWTRRSAGARM